LSKIKVKLEQGGALSYPAGVSLLEICREQEPGRGGDIIAAEVNGRERDLGSLLETDSEVAFLDFSSEQGARIYHHSSSHVLAQAVKRLYPDARLGIGPAIDRGFYYDFEFKEPLSADDLGKIEAEMERIIAGALPFRRRELSREEALDIFHRRGEPYKCELITDLPEDEPISIYEQGDFVDLCAGPHLLDTGKIGAVKLTGLAGAYWRGDERRPMLQRIYGTSFPTAEQLERHLELLAEAAKRDHRKLGRELDLFSLHEEGPGFPFFHHNGMVIIEELISFWRKEHRRAGYEEIRTPLIMNRSLWEQSGHWDHFRENMYFTRIDEQDYAVKPMNCPGAMLVYRSRMHSYRDLPRRIAELGLVHRHELSGTLHGLLRVRSFTQDDAHLFMTPDQIESEVAGVIEMVDHFYRVFGFKYRVELSTRPAKAMGSIEMWNRAEEILERVLRDKGLPYRINEGDGAFYGPKIDFHLEDCLGRSWQCSTIQLDFQMPEKFDLNYIGADGEKHRPVVIHRVIYGAIERFLALLIEQYAGAFPVWLAPQQAVVIPITEKQRDYAREVCSALRSASFRIYVDDRNEKVGYKIREAQLNKIPYMLIAGEREAAGGQIAVRQRERGDLGPWTLEKFVAQLEEDIAEKK
jgi:threonyl-tRNA synthetase